MTLDRPLITDRQRRVRLATRHGVHPDHRLGGLLDAVRAMTALHATDASTVHLALHARTRRIRPADVDHALYQERSLVKQLAMRRTLFVVDRDLLPAVLGSASARVAATQHRTLVRTVERAGIARDGEEWVAAARTATLTLLAGSGPLPARQIRAQVPELAGSLTYAPHKTYGGTVNIAPQVLTLLGAEGSVVRGPNEGHWRASRPTWTLMERWLGTPVHPLPSASGYTELVRRWLWTFGPGTLEDLRWWLGATKTATRAALQSAGAVPVRLEDGGTGWMLPEDLEELPEVAPWAALLPGLDPTTMGWKERGFYLDPQLAPYVFDTLGNGGTTAWWDGRIVGAWVQDEHAAVRVVPAPGVDLDVQARSALQQEADRLTAWLDGVVIANVYKSQLMSGAALP